MIVIELVLTICALTFVAPYYDCSEEWHIVLHDTNGIKCTRPEPTALGCATFKAPFKNDRIDLVSDYTERTGLYTPKLKHEDILWHELLHLMCECNWHAHWEVEKNDGRAHRYNQQPDIPETVIQHIKEEWRYK